MKGMLLAVVALAAARGGLAGEVRFDDTTITLPTYATGEDGRTPIFFTGRTYQGAAGRIYPYPVQDVLLDRRTDETYRYLTLENDWLQLGILPDHGGHLLNLTDRASGFETFYRQHVIKPALIGLLGAWISGGVEWNFPHHHRATTVMPVDWRETDNADGSKTIWLGETELRRRLKWTIGLTLMKDRAVLQAENVFMNRGPTIESMLYWANVSVACGEDYQVLFPPSCHIGYDHHKTSWTTYPFGPLVPYGEGEIDLSEWKSFTRASRSIFAYDPDNDWLAGWDHKRNAGTAHVSNRHITVGKKFFLWGNNDTARMWEKVLTDADGPYLELMVGCWSDNQPDYSWIDPYETRRVKQYWFPVKGIGGIKNVTIDGAVNLERRAPDEILLGFHSTRELKGCTVELTSGGKAVLSEKTDIDPDHPWCRTVKVDPEATDRSFIGSIRDADGNVFLSYRPERLGGERPPLPQKTAEPAEPSAITSAEVAYLTGLRLDQFHNGLVDPMPYYERALAIDPDYSAAHNAIGLKLLASARYDEAAEHFRRAADRVNRNYTRAKDAEPEYNLAVTRMRQMRDTEAVNLFWRVTWRGTMAREAYANLAAIACRKGDFDEALARIDAALERGAGEAKLHVIRAYVLRKLGRTAESDAAFARAREIDPLDYWGVALRDGLAAANENRGLKVQQLIEAVCDCDLIGARKEALAFCDADVAKGQPMLQYLKGLEAVKYGDMRTAMAAFDAAAAMKTERVFPSREEEYAALDLAAKLRPAANTWYYLGEVLWHFDRKDEAIAAWRNCIALEPEHALALRCLGFGLSHPGTYFTTTGVPSGIASEEAYGWYVKAMEADPSNFRALEEADRLAEKLGKPAAERRAFLERYRAAAEGYDPCMFRVVALDVALGRYDEAIGILEKRHFHVWEGGEDLMGPFVEALVKRADAKLAAGDADGAKADYARALTYPENLEARRPVPGRGDPLTRIRRAHAFKTLGREAEAAEEVAEVKAAIVRLEQPVVRTISAYRKFGGDVTPEEQTAKNRRTAEELKKMMEEFE